MNVTIRPSTPAGTVAAPPSKSMAHRLLICAGQTVGETTVRNVTLSEDVRATIDCLRALHVDCAFRDGDVMVTSYTPHCGEDGAVLPCRESGSTLRFFLPLCLFGPPITFTGDARLLARPLGPYEEICRKQGIAFKKDAAALRVQGRLAPGEFRLPGDVSSQFVSGLLFALPQLRGDSVLHLRSPLESRSYVDMTMAALRSFGVETTWMDRETVAVPGRQYYQWRPEVTVEGDWSNAAPFLAMGVPVTGLNAESLQGDRVCETYFDALRQGPATLGVGDCPDLGPLLFAFAAAHAGGTFTGTRRLRFKESDRGWAMQAELRKFGVGMRIEENQITVGHGLRAPTEPLDGHGDHRVVMALAMLCTMTGGTIAGAEAVSKSFPDFFERLAALGIGIERQ